MKFRDLLGVAAAVVAAGATALLPAMATAADAGGVVGKRPRICLVLSGGGARGAAHVGVLKVLEELHVPVHCIAGTSMGALVGAAYATGMTLPEMDRVLADMSVEKLFKEKPPRQELAMRRKRDDYQNYFTPEVGVGGDGGFVSKGVISGVQLETVLRQLSKVSGYHRFDALPIPLRVVATDLVTGKAVVFREGDIPSVMRASMSVPGAVAPAEFDGMMLVDGMLTSNLPVQAARAMGADVIIAVNVGTPLLKRAQLTNILGVAGQMLSILTEQNVQASIASLRATDILISPELGDFSTADFDNLPKITPLGEQAARSVAERLAKLAIPADQYAALRRRQQVALQPDLRPVDEIRIEPLQRVNPRAVRAAMLTEVGRPIDPALLDGDMRRIYGTDDFEHVNYRIFDEASRRVLAVEAVEKTWGPDYLRLGAGLSSDFNGDADFSFLVSYRQTWINKLGAEWRTDARLGNHNSLLSEIYQPIGAHSILFVAPRVQLEQRRPSLYQGDDRVATYDVASAIVALDVGAQFHTYGELRFGVETGRAELALDTGPDLLQPPSPRVRLGGVAARAYFDQLDSVNFPRKGWGGGARIFNSNRELGADQNYTKWSFDATAAYSMGEHALNLTARAGGKIGTDPLPPYDLFEWGGFLRQSGYATGQLAGQSLQYLRALYMHRLYRSGLLEGAYGGLALEAGKVGRPLLTGNPTGLLKSIAVFVAMDSLVGPVYLGYGRAASGADSFYFYLGRAL